MENWKLFLGIPVLLISRNYIFAKPEFIDIIIYIYIYILDIYIYYEYMIYIYLILHPWKFILWNLWGSLGTCSGNLACLPWELLGNLFLGTFTNLAWEPRLGTRSWQPLERGFLGTFAHLAWGNFACKPCLGILFWTCS